MKPIKWDCKIWCQSDRRGKKMALISTEEWDRVMKKMKFCLGDTVVQQLTSCLRNNNSVVMMDSYFTSTDLAANLKNQNTHA
jgi:hypothetical protein